MGLAAGPPPSVPPSDYAQIGKPDQAEGRRVIEQFRRSGPARPYYLEFDLHQLPRRGEQRVAHGRLWAGRNEDGAVLRIELSPGTSQERRFLVQNGEKSSVRLLATGSPAAGPGIVGALEPLLPGAEITAFDLQMPFLYWPDTILVGVNRIRGRPAHQFLFRPPADFNAGAQGGIAAVRAYLDTQYDAPVQTELIGSDGRVMKTLSLLDLQKIGNEWLPKDIEVRNEASRDKTRLSLTAAALDVPLSPSEFSQEALGTAFQPPGADRLTRFGP